MISCEKNYFVIFRLFCYEYSSPVVQGHLVKDVMSWGHDKLQVFSIIPVHPRNATGKIPIPTGDPKANIHQAYNNRHIMNYHTNY